jgi:hypothetical protein
MLAPVAGTMCRGLVVANLLHRCLRHHATPNAWMDAPVSRFKTRLRIGATEQIMNSIRFRDDK